MSQSFNQPSKTTPLELELSGIGADVRYTNLYKRIEFYYKQASTGLDKGILQGFLNGLMKYCRENDYTQDDFDKAKADVQQRSRHFKQE